LFLGQDQSQSFTDLGAYRPDMNRIYAVRLLH
jgi:hypothetical protein